LFCAFIWRNPNLFWTELTRSAPPPLANARSTKEKFCSHFLICARPIFSSKRKTKLFFGILLWTSRATGLRFWRAGKNFPPLKLSFNFCPPDWLSGKVWAGAESYTLE